MAIDAGVEALGRDDPDEAAAALRGARAVDAPDEQPLRLTQDVHQVTGHLPENAITTGFPRIDQQWAGGIRPGEFGVALAATNVGKTQCLCFFASSAYKADKYVLFYTFELSPKQTLRRIASAWLRRALTKVPVEEAPDPLAQARADAARRGGCLGGGK